VGCYKFGQLHRDDHDVSVGRTVGGNNEGEDHHKAGEKFNGATGMMRGVFETALANVLLIIIVFVYAM